MTDVAKQRRKRCFTAALALAILILGSYVHEKAEGKPMELLRRAEAQASTSSAIKAAQIAIKAAREQHLELTAAQEKIAALQKANRSLQEELVREMDKAAQKKVAKLRRANRALKAQLFRVKQRKDALIQWSSKGKKTESTPPSAVRDFTAPQRRHTKKSQEKKSLIQKLRSLLAGDADTSGASDERKAQREIENLKAQIREETSEPYNLRIHTHTPSASKSAVGVACAPPFCERSDLPAVIPGSPF